MRGYRETPPPDIFNRIEQTLARQEIVARRDKGRSLAKRIYRYLSVAAVIAAAFVAVLYFNSRYTTENTVPVAGNAIPSTTLATFPEIESLTSEKMTTRPYPPKDYVAHSDKAPEQPSLYAGELQETPEISTDTPSVVIEAGETPEERRTPSHELVLTRPEARADSGETALAKRTQEYWDKLIAQDNNTIKQGRGKKTAGSLYAGNFGTLKGDLRTDDPDRAASAGMLIKQTADKGSTLYSGLKEDNGRPVLAPGDPVTQGVALHHRMPLNIGLTLAIPINDRLSVRTGLNYSYLYSSSDQAFTSGHIGITRELHYIGVPLALSYTFYRTGDFGFYVQGGGMIEKAVAWRETMNFSTAEDTAQESSLRKVPGVQFSVNAAAGVSYDFSRHIGIYIEPGVTYYFGQKDQPENYRTVHPASFALRIGIKFGI